MVDHHAPADSAAELAQSFEEQSVELSVSDYRIEDWIAFALFWAMCAVVFLQFFTRYALNDSASWTEEIARYFLIAIVFIGSSMCVRLNRHIQVDLIYRYLPRAAGRVLATLVDLVRIAFLAYAAFLTWQVMERVGGQPMTMINLPMSIVYSFVLIGFLFMVFRAVLLARHHWRTGSSILEDPLTLESDDAAKAN